MTDDNLPPSIGERYGVAIGNGSTSAVVLAASLQRQRLGALLLRLAAEYDSVRQSLERAGQIPARNADAAVQLMAAASDYEDQARGRDDEAEEARERFDDAEVKHHTLRAKQLRTLAARAKQQAEEVRKRSADDIVRARAFILIELKTLAEAKRHVAGLALQMVLKPKTKHPIPRDVAMKLSGRVLDVYLDPMCHVCDGTGRTGSGYLGQTEKPCRFCAGTGQRRDTIGSTTNEMQFAAVLLGELDRRAKSAQSGMGRALNSDEVASVDGAATEDLNLRLSDLRAADAQVD